MFHRVHVDGGTKLSMIFRDMKNMVFQSKNIIFLSSFKDKLSQTNENPLSVQDFSG